MKLTLTQAQSLYRQMENKYHKIYASIPRASPVGMLGATMPPNLVGECVARIVLMAEQTRKLQEQIAAADEDFSVIDEITKEFGLLVPSALDPPGFGREWEGVKS